MRILFSLFFVYMVKCFEELITTPNDGLPLTQQPTTNVVQFDLIKVRLGSSIKLECNFNSNSFVQSNELNADDNSVYKMLWLKENKGVIAINNEVKHNRDKYSIESTSSNTLNLIIKNVRVEDNGKYICQHFDFPNLKQFLIVVLGRLQSIRIYCRNKFFFLFKFHLIHHKYHLKLTINQHSS